MNGLLHLSAERQRAHAVGQQKIKHYCSCARMFTGNAAWWSHRNANPDHGAIGYAGYCREIKETRR